MNGYGEWLGPSNVVKGGQVFQQGSQPGVLDIHVRYGHMQMRSTVDWITGEDRDEPLTVSLNDEDGRRFLEPLNVLIGIEEKE